MTLRLMTTCCIINATMASNSDSPDNTKRAKCETEPENPATTTSTPVHINDFPPEILQLIFSKLTSMWDLEYCKLVCKYWQANGIAYEKTLSIEEIRAWMIPLKLHPVWNPIIKEYPKYNIYYA